MQYEQLPDEWKEWLDLQPLERFARSEDWPVIELLVTIRNREYGALPTDKHIDFWLCEARTPELLVELCERFPGRAHELQASRSLLQLACDRSLDDLRAALDAEVRALERRLRFVRAAGHGERAVDVQRAGRLPPRSSRALRIPTPYGRRAEIGLGFYWGDVARVRSVACLSIRGWKITGRIGYAAVICENSPGLWSLICQEGATQTATVESCP